MQEDRSNVQWSAILIVSVLSLIILIFLYWNVMSVQGNMIKQAEVSYMQEQIHSMEASLAEIEQECQALNQRIISDPLIEQSLNKAQRKGLSEQELSACLRWQNKYSLSNMQLISLRGRVLWSVKEPNNQEEDVSYKRVIQKSLLQKESLVALEFAERNINIVSTAPLYTGDKFTGIFKLDISLEKALDKKLAKTSRAHYAVFQLDGIHSNLIWEDRRSQVVLNTGDIKKIHQGLSFYRPTQDKNTMLIIIPLQDMDNISIGYIQGELSRQAFQDARTNNLLFLLIMSLLILMTSTLIISREGISFQRSQDEAVKLGESGKISRVSINVNPVLKDNSADEKL